MERRIAAFLLLVDESDQANVDINGFIDIFNQAAVSPFKLRFSSVPTLSELSVLRAAPRIAPSLAAFELQQADLRQTGQIFAVASSSPPANGSPRPASQTRMPPTEFSAPLPPNHPAARTQSPQSTASAAAAAKAAADNLRATLLARAASKKPRASYSGSRTLAFRAGAMPATCRSQGSGTKLPSLRPPQSARATSSAPRSAAPPITAAPKPPAEEAPRSSSTFTAAEALSTTANVPPVAAAPVPSATLKFAATPSSMATTPSVTSAPVIFAPSPASTPSASEAPRSVAPRAARWTSIAAPMPLSTAIKPPATPGPVTSATRRGAATPSTRATPQCVGHCSTISLVLDLHGCPLCHSLVELCGFFCCVTCTCLCLSCLSLGGHPIMGRAPGFLA